MTTILDNAHIDHAIFELRPDYRALLLAVDGLTAQPSDATSEALLRRAEAAAQADTAVDQRPHIAAWREAYRAFGAKPQRTRNSVEALTRRPELPRVNRLTDIYNAISVLYELPIGGEDLDHYIGSPRLIRATGEEPFETVVSGEITVEHAEVGEVVWCDDAGITCRRWNWRQTPRTALTDETTRALFILDALGPLSDEVLNAAADELLAALGPDVSVERRLLTP